MAIRAPDGANNTFHEKKQSEIISFHWFNWASFWKGKTVFQNSCLKQTKIKCNIYEDDHASNGLRKEANPIDNLTNFPSACQCYLASLLNSVRESFLNGSHCDFLPHACETIMQYIQIKTYCHTFSLKRHVLQCLNLIYPTFYGGFLWCSSKQDVTGLFVKM